MNYYGLKTSICFLILLFSQSQAGLAAPVGPEGDPIPCGLEDDVCITRNCSNDPDCPPSDLPDNPTQPLSGYPSRPSDIKDCTSLQTTEIAAAMDFGADDWHDYETALEDIRDWSVNIGNCLKDRFQKDGKVVCEKTMRGGCTTKDGPANGWASPFPSLSKKVHMCPDFLDRISKLPGPATNRQACYFALFTHESGHTCERGHKTLEIIDDEAVIFWKATHPEVTISLSDCGMK